MKLAPKRPRTINSVAELEHERLNSLIRSMADGVIAVDEDAKIVLYNGAALNILDANDNLTDKPLSDAIKLYDQNGQAVDVVTLVKATTSSISSRDYLLRYADGSIANLYLSIAPVKLGYGEKGDSGFVLLLRDITREKSLEEERDEFISVVSHELRTPIAISEGNISNAEFIADKTGDIEQIKEALKTAHEQIVFLSGLINDLATLSRAERGVLQVEPKDISTSALLADLKKTYEKDAAAKGLELKIDPEAVDTTFRSGDLYVREILQNFITNAIKYTETGSVTIGARPSDKGVVFTVKDTGIGISKTDQEKVFDKFFRSEDYRTRKNSGTGLGLYVTMKLVRLLHAEIRLDSEINKGSTFSVFIPTLDTPLTSEAQ